MHVSDVASDVVSDANNNAISDAISDLNISSFFICFCTHLYTFFVSGLMLVDLYYHVDCHGIWDMTKFKIGQGSFPTNWSSSRQHCYDDTLYEVLLSMIFLPMRFCGYSNDIHLKVIAIRSDQLSYILKQNT
jgi:hypothetical protein